MNRYVLHTVELASSRGHSQIFNDPHRKKHFFFCASLKNWEWPRDEATAGPLHLGHPWDYIKRPDHLSEAGWRHKAAVYVPVYQSSCISDAG